MEKKFELLTGYIPALSEDALGTWVIDDENDGSKERPIQFPFAMYSDLVQRFKRDVLAVVEQDPHMLNLSYSEVLERNNIPFSAAGMQEADVRQADAVCVLMLLVAAIRADRFSEGFFLRFLQDGTVTKWLLRLSQLDGQG